MLPRLIATSLLSLLLYTGVQAGDTLRITPKDINTRVLVEGNHRWLVYFKMGKDSSRKLFNIWTRNISRLNYKGQPAIAVTQQWEDNDSIMHSTYTVCSSNDFHTIFHESWWKQRGRQSYDFLTGEMKVNNRQVPAGDTIKATRMSRSAFDTALTQYNLNWHLDLEVFPLLPYKEGRCFAINFYDPGFGQPKWVYYTVTGTAVIKGYNGQDIPCWTLVHTDNERGSNEEVFYISKKTMEVLKLEQRFNGRFRYKVKLPFTD
jgi:hypothetical protein